MKTKSGTMMIIDEIMESFCELEKQHNIDNKPLPTDILLSMSAYKELPPSAGFGNNQDMKICGVPVSVTNTEEFKFKWIS